MPVVRAGLVDVGHPLVGAVGPVFRLRTGGRPVSLDDTPYRLTARWVILSRELVASAQTVKSTIWRDDDRQRLENLVNGAHKKKGNEGFQWWVAANPDWDGRELAW